MRRAAVGSACLFVSGLLAAAWVGGCATGGDPVPEDDAGTPTGDGGGDATVMNGADGGSPRDTGRIPDADAATDGGTSANPDGTTGADSEAGPDAGGDAEAEAEAGTEMDAGADVGVASDSGHDAAVGADSGTDAPADSGGHGGADAEAGPELDASADAADASDASSAVGFGTTCAAGTVYSDPFATDPLALGRWTTLIGPVTYDATNHLLQLAQGTPNTQAWIGARPAWTNYTVSVPIRIDSTVTGNGGINFRMTDPGPANPPNDSGKMYFAGINPTQVLLGLENTGWTQLGLVAATFTVGTFYTLTVTANGSSLSVAVDGTTYVTVTDTTIATGGIGIRTYLAGASYGTVSVTCNP